MKLKYQQQMSSKSQDSQKRRSREELQTVTVMYKSIEEKVDYQDMVKCQEES